MECRGAFTAQHFKLLSADPNTIFQFFVFDDRVVAVKVGTAANQIPQVLSKGVSRPRGLKDHAAAGLPSLSEARELVNETSK